MLSSFFIVVIDVFFIRNIQEMEAAKAESGLGKREGI